METAQEYYFQNGSGPFRKHFDECEHDNIDSDAADPSVGIFSEAIWCEDCGAEAHDWMEDAEVDEEGCVYSLGVYPTDWERPLYAGEEE